MRRRTLLAAAARAAGAAVLAALGRRAIADPRPPGAAAPTQPGEPRPPEVTRHVAEFVARARLEDVPAEVLALAKRSILDGLGLALAGSVSTLAPPLVKYVAELGSRGTSGVVGTSLRVAPRFAAFANGAFVHADDFDDTQLAAEPDRVYGLLTHPTAPVLPPALAICQARGGSGRDLLTAYLVGVEVECKLAEAIAPRHYVDGFHSTGTIGSFGSAAAAAKLRRLDAPTAAQALGIAAAEAGGLRANFGSMTKPFHAGHAAEAGVVAADLAALGWTAAPDVLEARFGFFRAAGGGFDPGAIMGRLGNPWTLAAPGVSLKPFPSGSLTHPAMGEVLRLVREHDLQARDVARVEVGGSSRMVTTLLHHRPTTGLQAKFSMEFGVAVLLLERRAGLAEYTDAVVRREDVQRMIRRVDFHVDPEAERAGFDRMTSVVRIHTAGGRVLSGRAQFAKGSPASPMSDAEVADKFRGCAEFARWPRARVEGILDLVPALERQADLGRLGALLTA